MILLCLTLKTLRFFAVYSNGELANWLTESHKVTLAF